MTLFLEMLCEEVILSPGHKVELFAEDQEKYFPMHISYHSDSLQIYPQDGTPRWLIKFNEKEIVPSYPTKLKDYE